MNTVREIHDFIRNFELKHRRIISALNQGHINYWPVLRLALAFDKLPTNKGKITKEKLEHASFTGTLKSVKKADHLVFTVSNQFSNNSDDQWRLPIIDELSKYGSIYTIGYVRPEEWDKYNKRNLKGFDAEIGDIIRLRSNKIVRMFFFFPSLIVLLKAAKLLEKNQYRNLLKRLINVRLEAFLFQKLIKKCSPRLAHITFGSYGNEGFILACKKLGVPIVEYQHSAIYPEHPGYNYTKELFPIKNQALVPDYLATYGRYWKQVLTTNCQWFSEFNVLVVGKGNLKEIGTEKKDAVVVCTTPYLSASFRKMVKLHASKFPQIEVVIKLHPRETQPSIDAWRTFAQDLENVSLTSIDTMSLFSQYGVLLSGESTTVIEAAYYGLTIYCIKDDNFKIRESEIFPKYCQFITFDYDGPLVSLDSPQGMEQYKDLYQPLNLDALKHLY